MTDRAMYAALFGICAAGGVLFAALDLVLFDAPVMGVAVAFLTGFLSTADVALSA